MPAPPIRDWKPAFLKTLSATANVRLAAAAAGIDRTTAYKARAKGHAFAAEWDAAVDDALDLLEGAAFRRAHEGSDALTMFLLRANRPAKYRETIRQEHANADDKPFKVNVYLPDNGRDGHPTPAGPAGSLPGDKC